MARKSITRGGEAFEGMNQIHASDVSGNDSGWGIGIASIMEGRRDISGFCDWDEDNASNYRATREFKSPLASVPRGD